MNNYIKNKQYIENNNIIALTINDFVKYLKETSNLSIDQIYSNARILYLEYKENIEKFMIANIGNTYFKSYEENMRNIMSKCITKEMCEDDILFMYELYNIIFCYKNKKHTIVYKKEEKTNDYPKNEYGLIDIMDFREYKKYYNINDIDESDIDYNKYVQSYIKEGQEYFHIIQTAIAEFYFKDIDIQLAFSIVKYICTYEESLWEYYLWKASYFFSLLKEVKNEK